MKRVLSFLMAFAMVLSLLPATVFAAEAPTTLYLKPNSNWTDANARFAAYFFGNGETWVGMTGPNADGIYQASVPSGYPNVIFCRMNPGTEDNTWDNKWNQTADLTVPTDGTDLYTVADGTWDNGGGTWSTFASAPVDPEPDPPKGNESVTVYCINSMGWDTVAAHAWNSGTGTTWPGEQMTKTGETVNGFDVYTVTFQTAYDGIIFNNNNAGLQTENLTLQNGQYYDLKNGAWYESLDKVPVVDPLSSGAYLVGSFNIWNTSADEFRLAKAGDTVGTVSLTLDAEKSYEFKVVNNGAWLGGDAEITDTAANIDFTSTGGNVTITTKAAGSYVFTFDTASSKLSVTYPAASGETGHKVTFVIGESQTTQQSVDDGAKVVKPQDPERTGYTFAGWFADAAYTTAYDFDSEVTADLTLYAKWTIGDVIVHYYNADQWAAVAYHAWNGDGTGDLTTWPGIMLTEETDHAGWYTVRLENLKSSDGIGILFHNNSGNQTSNIPIPAGGEYWYDGELKTTAPESWESTGDGTVSYEATLHFVNTLGWGAVNLYTWTEDGTTLTGSWPGSAVKKDANGFYSRTVTFEAPAGQGLNFIFNNGGTQTVDLKLDASDFTDNKAEKWVVPTNMTDGKYNADILSSGDAIAISPIVEDSSVTFQYKAADAATVAVYGSWDDWETETPMTKNEYGVWSVTLENIPNGIQKYLFRVDGQDVLDPMNAWTEDGKYSAFLISDPDQDQNKITISIHYTRADGNYEGWNVYAWGAEDLEKQYDLTVGDGEATTAIVFTNARAVQGVSFKLRKSVGTNLWEAEEAQIDVPLGNVVSGTIYVYTGNGSTRQVLGDDVVYANKISDVQLDYENNAILIETYQAVADQDTAFALVKGEEVIQGTTVTGHDGSYTMTLPEDLTLDLVTLYQYKIIFSEQKNENYKNAPHDIGIDNVYATDKFAEEYASLDAQLGVSCTSTASTFRLWAPTAEEVTLQLYATGSDWEEGAEDLGSHVMNRGEKGVWSVTLNGDYQNVYYTYLVTVDGEQVEAVDPYARAVGVNGGRGMVINLDSTDPADGWTELGSKPASYTDAVIYELHIRDFSYGASSGISEANRGKYLAFTETGSTVNGNGSIPTGVDYLKDLGVTHVHLLPFYDYGSVDETGNGSFNWGYDPVNYNVPEGSYSSNPYDGSVRVREAKEMVDSLHENGIGVIMDVVYNHVYDADSFSFNKIVPGYFSRVDSNRSGCGNDTASEREMVRKFIVESVLYWAQEYHIDGFRFDLVGLLDVQTINEIVTQVHAVRPDILFYGEGWDMDGTNKEPGTEMAKQGNASKTPGFAYFSDSMRDLLAGSNGRSTGFVSGSTGREGDVVSNFMAKPWWTSNPNQVVQYASCHDNYTLIDKLVLSTGSDGITGDIVKMNNLAAAMYMTSQGIPFIHAGEEMLREKLNENGGRVENSYNASDYVNSLRWENLNKESYASTHDYYKGLIAFRAAHPALRMTTASAIKANVYPQNSSDNLVSFWIDGSSIPGETHDSIYVIFNANASARNVQLPDGNWDVCINGTKAGTAVLQTVSGNVSVDGISAMVLVQKTSTQKPTQTKSDVALPGGFNNWNQANYMNTTDTQGIVTQTLSLPAGTYEFKIKNGDTWLGNNGTICDSTEGAENGWEMSTSAGNCKLQASGGAYTFTFNTNTNYLMVTYDPNGGDLGDPGKYYLCGYINAKDYAMDVETGEYEFVDGKLTTTFDSDSYVVVKNGDSSKRFMTKGYLGQVTEATLYPVSSWQEQGYDKLLVPGGTEVTFTLTVNEDDTVTLSYTTASSGVVDASGVQKGVTLHCWNWSFDNIKANMAAIAQQGYTAIQTSPIQPLKEATNLTTNTVGSHWWVYYQPVDFTITTESGNALGTKSDFAEMCAEADKYGIKVIVDVVANHLGNKTGNDLADAVPEYLRQDGYWHDITTNITNWNDRFNMTQYCLDGLPDLNTGNTEIQGYVLDFLKECVDAGADGFRFDMAKSIELPGEKTEDGITFGSDFWPNVIGGIQEYAGNRLYIYGEVLDNPVISASAYTKYMAVTDNSWGNNLRNNIASGNAAMAAGYHKAVPASNLVIWAESHDTYATDNASQNSSGVSEADINKTWALVAARGDAMGLYLARPESMTQALGVASATGWDNPEVRAANRFHNAFVGEGETVGNSGTISYVIRGTTGIVMVNTKGTTADITLAVDMADGTYTDQITGNTFTVADGTISGTMGDTGIAVVYNAETPSAAKIGTTEYATLGDAINAAVKGDKIVQTADTQETSIMLKNGVTLDLNGHTLTVTKSVVTLSGNNIVDSIGGGVLKVPKDRITLQKTNAYLNVWNGEGYRFIDCEQFKHSTTNIKNGKKYVFLPYLDPADYELLARGAESSGVAMKVQVTWTTAKGKSASAVFKYTDELIQRFYENYDAATGKFGSAFKLTLTGTNSVSNLSFRVYFESDLGVQLTCTPAE